jgi:two-component system, OmpR family, response regulator
MKVLLVDDNDGFRVSMGAVLEDAGHSVAEAASLGAARVCLEHVAFDVAVLDFHLGDGVGPELVPEIRRRRPGTRVVLMSGSADSGGGGADLTIAKGDDPFTIVQRLEELARRP